MDEHAASAFEGRSSCDRKGARRMFICVHKMKAARLHAFENHHRVEEGGERRTNMLTFAILQWRLGSLELGMGVVANVK